MNVFNNVSTQVSGLGSSLGSWFKKDGSKAEETPEAASIPKEKEEPEAAPTNEKIAKQSDDAASQHSGSTEGADSNPVSEGEDEANKAGITSGLASFNLSGVSSKASAGAKSVGSFFSSAFSKAGATVKEAGSRIKESVEKNALLSEFNKEQEAFIAAKGGKAGEAHPPWVGYPQEETLKKEILGLSTDRRNFVRSPPTGVNFEFELEQFLPVAQATLAEDSNLEKMRFELVPKTVNEETFWRNYFYRVGLIRQSTELSSMESDQPSDACDKPSKDGKNEKDWEAELQKELGADLGDYEVVTDIKDEKWDKELQNMIDEEDSTSDLR